MDSAEFTQNWTQTLSPVENDPAALFKEGLYYDYDYHYHNGFHRIHKWFYVPTGSTGPGGFDLHPEGREGGYQDGGDHGARVPGVLDALRKLCHVGREPPWFDL